MIQPRPRAPAASADTLVMPLVGLGTWQSAGETAASAVAMALHAGYRHIDTAPRYDNEEAVGEGLRRGGLARQDLFITTKV